MFYIFLLQTNDLVYETTTQQSIDFDVNELLNDDDIGSSIELMKVLQKTLKNNMQKCLIGIGNSIDRRDERKGSSVDTEMPGLEIKLRNHNVNSFRTL